MLKTFQNNFSSEKALEISDGVQKQTQVWPLTLSTVQWSTDAQDGAHIQPSNRTGDVNCCEKSKTAWPNTIVHCKGDTNHTNTVHCWREILNQWSLSRLYKAPQLRCYQHDLVVPLEIPLIPTAVGTRITSREIHVGMSVRSITNNQEHPKRQHTIVLGKNLYKQTKSF
jgi:hypothetical protein